MAGELRRLRDFECHVTAASLPKTRLRRDASPSFRVSLVGVFGSWPLVSTIGEKP